MSNIVTNIEGTVVKFIALLCMIFSPVLTALSMLTGGIIPSTTHQVINPPTGDYTHRYSIPFFGDIPSNTVLRSLDKCRTSESTDETSYITYGEFFVKRLQAIGFNKMKQY